MAELETDPIALQILAEQRGEALPPGPGAVPLETARATEPDPIARALSLGPAAELPGPTEEPDSVALQILQEQREADTERANLLRWRETNDKVDPTRRADVLRYSAASGFLPDFVDQNLDEVRHKVDSGGVNWAEVVHRQPVLTRFLMEQPQVQPLVKDEYANVGKLEWALNAPSIGFHAFWDAVNEQRVVGRQFLEAMDWGSEENRERIEELQREYSNKTYGAESLAAKGIVGAARMLPFMAMDLGARMLGGVAGTAIAGLAGGTGGAVAGAPAAGAGAIPGAAVGATAGGITGGVLGQFVGSGIFNYYESLGPLYWQFSQMKDAKGEPLDPDVARAFAHSAALITGGVMSVGLGTIGKSIPGVKDILAKAGRHTVEKALVTQTTNQALARMAKQYGQHVLTGGVMMGAQSAVNATAGEIAKAASGQDFHGQEQSILEAAADGFMTGVEDMWLLLALPHGPKLLRDLGRARSSAEGAVMLEAMTESAASSKLLERSPQKFQELVAAMKAEKGAVKTVHVPSEEWARYWQEQKLDPAEMAAAVMEDGGKAYSEALGTKGDLAIPVEKYLAKLARTPHAKGLAPDRKLRADDLTPRQFAEEQTRQATRMEEEAKRRDVEIREGKQEVATFIREQAEGAGASKTEAADVARLVSEPAGTFALRLGTSVRESARVMGLGALRILGPKGEAVAAAAREKFRRFLAPEATQYLEERLASVGEAEQGPFRAREHFLDDVTGLRNRRAWEATERQPGKQVAVITSPDTKGVNDSPVGGHVAADAMLRVLGAEAFKADPEAARSGTNFLVHVKDRAELDALLAKAKAALGDERLGVLGELGRDVQEAGERLDLEVSRRRGELTPEKLKEIGKAAPTAEEALPARGGLKEGLDVSELKFEAQKATSAIPDALVTEMRGLSRAEYAKRTYLDRIEVGGEMVDTGLLSAEGWRAIPRKAYALAMDLKGLRPANEKYGKEVGNQLLLRFATLASHLGGSSFDMTHRSGDEYVAQHNNSSVMEGFAKKLRALLLEHPLEVLDGVTGKTESVAVEFRYGLGRDYAQADRALNAAKSKEAKLRGQVFAPDVRGVGVVAGDVQPGERPPGTGVPGEVRPGAPLGRRERALGRGAAPQSFGEVARLEQPPADLPLTGGPIAHLEGATVTFSPDPIAEALRFVSRMTDPARQEMAQAWLEYVTGQRKERPTVTPEIEKTFANEWGLVDPVHGFAYDEQGRSTERAIGGPRRKGEEPAELRRYRLERQARTPEEWQDLTYRTLYEQGPGARGSIELRLEEGGRPVAFDIRILKADKSTLAHELGHFLSWSFHEIASSDLAGLDIQNDYGSLLKWMGYASGEERLAQTEERAKLLRNQDRTTEGDARLKELTAKEERLSHGLEQYLFEGKAPTKDLARVFSRFSQWLTRIYRGVKNLETQYRAQYGQDIELSDEVRLVFDRLLARSEALERAHEDIGMDVSPPREVLDAMTPEERRERSGAWRDWQVASEKELAERMGPPRVNEMVAARRRIAAEVAAELDRQPVYRAMRYLQHGEVLDAEGKLVETAAAPFLDQAGQPFKLNRASFIARYGQDAARQMPSGVFSRKKKGGVDIEQLAPLLGFDDGAAMVEAFRATEPRDKLISRQTQERLRAEIGPALDEYQEAALAAVHNEHLAEVTLRDLRTLAKTLDPAIAGRIKSIRLDSLKATAERLVGDTALGELDPARYVRAERRAAIKAAELWGRGEKEQSMDQREVGLWNQVLYRTARDAQDESARAREKLEATSEDIRATLGKANPAYRDAHDRILAAVNFGRPVVEGKTLEQFLEVADNEAQQVAFDVDGIRKLLDQPKEWDELTVDEARRVADAVTNIRHLARQTHELELEGRRLEKDTWFAGVRERLKKRKPLPPAPYSKTAEGLREKLGRLGRGADALFTETETYSHMLDVGERHGPVHRLLVDARLVARQKEADLHKAVLERVFQKWDAIPAKIKKLRDKRVDVAHLLPVPPTAEGRLAPVYTRDNLWMLFLNWGNEGNRQRIRDGNGWADANVEQALSLLTKPELEFLQGTLDTINSLWPEIAALHEKRTGLKLGKVEATPIVINGETHAGGYFPLRYDARIAIHGELQEGDVVKALFGPNYVRPATPRGHTKSRLEKVTAPVDLTWGVVPAHLGQVIHDVAYGDWVRQTGAVFFDPRWKALTNEYLGPERAREFVPWLRDVANARADAGSLTHSEFLKRLGDFARNRAASTVMGLNLPNIIGQVVDPLNAALEGVPYRHVAQAYVKVTGSLTGAVSLPELKLSKALAYLDGNRQRNIRERFREFGRGRGRLAKTLDIVNFGLYELMDRFTTRVTWKAAFDAALSESATMEDAAARADDVVRRLYVSYELAEKPPIMRTRHGVAGLVMFYSFANRQYNSLRRSFDTMSVALGEEALPTKEKAAAVARFASKLLFLGVNGAAFAYLAGRGPKEEEDRLEWLAWRVALESFNTVPFLGGAVEGLFKGQKINVRTAPELALLQDVIGQFGKAVEEAVESGQDGDEEAMWRTAEVLLAAGLVLRGGPAGQAMRTAKYMRRVVTGVTQPDGALELTGGVIYGERPNRPANPLTDLAEMVE